MSARGKNQSPAHVRALNARLQSRAGSQNAGQILRRTVANTVVAQMLPAGAVKGGVALKFRLGEATTRFTADLDAAHRHGLERFVVELQDNLIRGWSGFNGRLVTKQPPKPVGIPPEYVMRPFEVRMSYLGKDWMTVPLEIGHDEIGDTELPDLVLSSDIVDIFAALGLPRPAPIAVLPIPHQVAQKIHASSAPGSERAHDLVDLQLLSAAGLLADMLATRVTCQRLFVSRGSHTWPPVITAGAGWPALYAEAAGELNVLPDVGQAIAWVNALIDQIEGQRE